MPLKPDMTDAKPLTKRTSFRLASNRGVHRYVHCDPSGGAASLDRAERAIHDAVISLGTARPGDARIDRARRQLGRIAATRLAHAVPKQVGTVQLQPTWRGVMPLLIAGITEGTDTGRRIATEELYRLADIADSMTRQPEPLGADENIGSIAP